MWNRNAMAVGFTIAALGWIPSPKAAELVTVTGQETVLVQPLLDQGHYLNERTTIAVVTSWICRDGWSASSCQLVDAPGIEGITDGPDGGVVPRSPGLGDPLPRNPQPDACYNNIDDCKKRMIEVCTGVIGQSHGGVKTWALADSGNNGRCSATCNDGATTTCGRAQ